MLFFFKQKTAYEMRISDWSSDVCSSDLAAPVRDRVDLTLDPTERHGFAYQSWFGFSIFVPGQGDAIGRGGGYAIPVGDTQEEPAVGFSLYPDPLIDEGLGSEDVAERRIFLPLGHDPMIAAGLRADGRAEERSVGKEGVHTCRPRWAQE